MSWYFSDPRSRRELVTLYEEAQQRDRPWVARWFLIFASVTMIVLLGLDHVLFGEHASFFRPYRFVSLAICGICFALLRSRRCERLVLVLPPLWFNTMSAYLLVASPADEAMVLYGNVLCIIFTGIGLCRFWREIYLNQILSMLALVALAVAAPEKANYCAALFVAHLTIMLATWFLRREFAGSLFARFETLRALMPLKVARIVALSVREDEMERAFTPRTRDVVCVSADWRGYQAITRTHQASVISTLFRAYYETVLSTLDVTDPSGAFFVDWTADELFVVFFDDHDDTVALRRRAARFAMALTTDVPRKVLAQTGFPLLFDIGVAAGPGLLGLQGPRRMMKTTVVSEVAGIAKRLETEAKILRISEGRHAESPILALDDTMQRTFVDEQIVAASALESRIAHTKDITNQRYWVWQAPAANTSSAASERAG